MKYMDSLSVSSCTSKTMQVVVLQQVPMPLQGILMNCLKFNFIFIHQCNVKHLINSSSMHEYISEAHSGPFQTSNTELSANAKSFPTIFRKSFILGVCRVPDSIVGTIGYTVFNIQMEITPS